MTSSNVVETHISILFFVGDRVYKLRKAVRFGFLDFTDRAARRADCEREVALNRRLAPDVYLGVADLVLGGEPVEHMAVMKRLPQERALARLARDGAALGDCVTAVARVLASFHAGALRSPEISNAAEAKALGRVWESNFEELGPFVGSCLDPRRDERIKELARRYLQGRAPLFAARIASGRVCDGHGDLQAEDIFCLDDGPRILDCIEFDDSLRYGDVVADVSFLVMDLERLGRPEAASAFVEAYQEFAGDRFPPSLLDHYCAMRAYVRAEVACLRHAQGDERARSEARRLHDLALGYLERARARLVVVGGLPGTGKSTLAARLAESQGWTLLRSDEVRKELFGPAPGESPQRPG